MMKMRRCKRKASLHAFLMCIVGIELKFIIFFSWNFNICLHKQKHTTKTSCVYCFLSENKRNRTVAIVVDIFCQFLAHYAWCFSRFDLRWVRSVPYKGISDLNQPKKNPATTASTENKMSKTFDNATKYVKHTSWCIYNCKVVVCYCIKIKIKIPSEK